MLPKEDNLTVFLTLAGFTNVSSPSASCVHTLSGRNIEESLLFIGEQSGEQHIGSSHLLYITK